MLMEFIVARHKEAITHTCTPSLRQLYRKKPNIFLNNFICLHWRVWSDLVSFRFCGLRL